MKKENGRYSIFNNSIKKSHSRKVDKWQKMFVKKFNYDPNEKYTLSTEENKYLGDIFGLKNIIRGDEGEPFKKENAVIISTIRMGFGHYRIAMAGASCAKAMGFTPYWLDLLSVPGITTDVIGWCNTNYSKWSRVSQKSKLFNKYIWEPLTTGERFPLFNSLLNSWIVTWPWRFLKTNIKDYKMSELFRNLYQALPSDTPILTSHMWNCMGAVAGGMTNVVDMMFDNWPMAFQLTEGAKHGAQSPASYFGFKTLRGFDEKDRVLNPLPEDVVYNVGHHIDHELVENIEEDCQRRIKRVNENEPRRFLITMGGAGAQKELFKAVIEHALPKIRSGEVTLFVNLGDHKNNWEWLQKELSSNKDKDLINTHFSWEETKEYSDSIRDKKAEGLHIFLYDNIFHAVYATNYLMRVTDVLITKPSELAFYPVPKIFNERVGGHEMWGAVRSAEIGDGTLETRSPAQTIQAMDICIYDNNLLKNFCYAIIQNKQIGLYDGAYKCVEFATGKKFRRHPDPTIKV